VIDKEMFVRYKRPRKSLKQRRKHSRAGGSIFDSVIASSSKKSLCKVCGKSDHSYDACQSISLKRIADAVEKMLS
jgi:hypothetical protein